MQEPDDIALLREYLNHDSEEAFATLVARHVNKVYSVALRHTGKPHQAEEITQAVFVILARKSRNLGKKVILSGWLFRTARLTALTFIRSEIRRVRREQEAQMQNTLNETASDAWLQIAPLLDAAIAGLNEAEQHAIVLRYFDGKSMKEVGAALGGSEDAAKMRVNRAVEKMRRFLMKRGVVLPAVTLTAVISANCVQAAPTALAKTAIAVAFAKGATASGSTLTLIKAALKLMAWTKAKTMIVAGVVALLAVGTTTVTVKEIEARRLQVWQKGLDMAVLDTVPRQARILPALRSRSKDIHGWGEYHGMLLGLNQGAAEIVFAAYNVSSAPRISRGRMIFSVPVPEGTYDFISNVPQNQCEALQREIKKEFGLVGRREWIETNVLVLTVRNPNAAGLKGSTSGSVLVSRLNGFISLSNTAIANLPILLENNMFDTQNKILGTPVVDRTGLAGYFDLKWETTPNGLEKAVLNDLGLELVPGKDRVEFLVVDKAN